MIASTSAEGAEAAMEIIRGLTSNSRSKITPETRSRLWNLCFFRNIYAGKDGLVHISLSFRRASE